MRIELITLFPEVAAFLDIGLLAKARQNGHFELETLTPREFTTDRHRSVDDGPYGGGSGVVMTPGPLIQSLEHLDAQRASGTHRILLSPQGKRFCQRDAERLSKHNCLTFVAARYEGVDERVREEVHEELSIGDFVLLGGEVAALTMIEAIVRLIPGVLGNAHSAVEESHSMGLLEHPQYTRPAEFRGKEVPPVLLSGNHEAIRVWRRKESLRRTLERRPDMLRAKTLSDEDLRLLAEIRPDWQDAMNACLISHKQSEDE